MSRQTSSRASSRPAQRPSRAPVVRALFALGIVVTALVVALVTPVRLGLDLSGGTQIVMQTRDSGTVKADAESTDRALEVLRRRVDALGVSEPTLTRSGDTRIIVELPGLDDPAKAAEVLGQTAQLTFHPVLGEDTEATPTPTPTDSASPSPTASPTPSPSASPTTPADPTKARTLPDESGAMLKLGPAELTGDGVSDARAELDQQTGSQWSVAIDFRGDGKDAWEKMTGEAACEAPGDPKRRVAIVLDDEIISSPSVADSVECGVGITGGTTQITGDFTGDEAKDLAALIKGGALPVPVDVIEQRTVGPTLGDAAIEASWKAAIIGVALTAIFIVVIYRLVGFLATIALATYALISYAALVALGATLTLPGLAGFVLAIGMAVDANVLVFERAREEYVEGRVKGTRGALNLGFNRALSAILDSNMTTLLAAALLFWWASGPVKGFGVTLSIGVLASMISALLITRVLAEWAVTRKSVVEHPGITGVAKPGRVREWLVRRDFDVMSKRKLWLSLSAAAVLIASLGIVVRGINLGVEFTGGRLMEYTTSKSITVDEARDAVTNAGFPRAVVNESGDNGIAVRDADIDNDEEAKIRAELSKIGGDVTKERDELIGPTLSDELRQGALIALAVALLAQLAYLKVRFRWSFALGAVIGMFHDLVIVVGLFAWLGKTLDGVFLAALLTVIGYSVNDSVVVFDRVREAWGASPRTPFARVANTAALQTVPRTVNTGLGAVFILAALAFLGGESLTDFAVALLVGILVGTYSSVFVATPLAVIFEGRSGAAPPRVAQKQSRPKASAGAGRRRPDSGAVV